MKTGFPALPHRLRTHYLRPRTPRTANLPGRSRQQEHHQLRCFSAIAYNTTCQRRGSNNIVLRSKHTINFNGKHKSNVQNHPPVQTWLIASLGLVYSAPPTLCDVPSRRQALGLAPAHHAYTGAKDVYLAMQAESSLRQRCCAGSQVVGGQSTHAYGFDRCALR